ncbi:MAG: hypothetical protein JSW13_05705 [Candidatus Aerophobus sp.]|nr:MAG: hypothetical protein JSW13_05705 [Candidatus Aerophobus sp.]
MDYNRLERELCSINNLLGSSEIIVKVFPLKPSRGHLAARLSSQNEMQVSIDEDWDISQDSALTRYLGRGYHEHPLLEIGEDLLCNQLAHHQICPHNMEFHHQILEGVGQAIGEQEKKSCIEYLTHAFEDVIANAWCKLNFSHFKGMPAFFYDQAYLPPSVTRTFKDRILEILFSPRFSPLYEAFVKINLLTWGDEEDLCLVKRCFTNRKSIKAAVEKVIRILNLGGGSLEHKIDILSRNHNWQQLAFKFSLGLRSLLQGKPKEELSSDNQYQRNTINPALRKRIVKTMYENKRKPSYLTSFEITRTLYEILSPEIPMQVDTQKRGSTMPLVPFNYEAFDPERHSREDIDLYGLAVDPESPFFELINFRVPRYHYDLFIPYKPERKGAFPDICFLIDTSASMANDIQSKISPQTLSLASEMMKHRFYFGEDNYSWSNKSKYHHVLLGFTGALKWLRSCGIAPYIEYNLITFSRNTLATGWKNYQEIDDCRRLAYLPEFDTTLLEAEVLREELLNRPFLVMIILTDGEIFNWNESTRGYAPYRLKNLVKSMKPVSLIMKEIVEKNIVSHIQISEGDFKPRISDLTCRELQKWGAEVHRINDIANLETLMINLTQKAMSPYL